MVLKKTTFILATLALLLLILAVGCEKEPEKVFTDPSIEAAGHETQQSTLTNIAKNENLPATDKTEQETVNTEELKTGQDIERENEQEKEVAASEKEQKNTQPEPYCGDGTCNEEENCGNCKEDCACQEPEVCSKGECLKPECEKDADCADDNVCTEDKCYFAGDIHAYCGHEKIRRCSDIDGCCPLGCNANNDKDCEPKCGNGICEEGEDEDNCAEDCIPETVCGNQVCEQGEDENNCPEDCLSTPVCGNGICEEGEDIRNCYEDCMQ